MSEADWKTKISHLSNELSSLVHEMSSSSNATESSDDDANEMDMMDEGDPGTQDDNSAGGDSKEFEGSHDRHVSAGGPSEDGSDASEESAQAGGFDDKEKKKSMLLSILKKHG